MMYRALAMMTLVGCNNFTTVDEACLEEVPGVEFMSDTEDQEIAARVNCYRRVANEPKVVINEAVQAAVEGHIDYLELQAPLLDVDTQREDLEGFTGRTASDRLRESGYVFPVNAALLQASMQIEGAVAVQFTGVDHVDFWMADPFTRPVFLQPTLAGAGMGTADYEYEFPADLEVPNMAVSVAYYNMIYRYTQPPIAEAAKVYPRNGQIDAPGSYLHLTDNTPLEAGRTYGYPITFTVGSRETGMVIDQANLSGPDGSIPIQILSGADAGGVGLFNTAIIVPEQPLAGGQTYSAFVQIVSDQGTRRARTTFTVGADPRPIPAGFARSLAPEALENARFSTRITLLDESPITP